MRIRAISFFLAITFIFILAVTACSKNTPQTQAEETTESETQTKSDDTDQEEEAPGAVAPEISGFMTEENYFDVQGFYIYNNVASSASTPKYEPIIGFSFIDLSLRENTILASRAFMLSEEFRVDGYEASEGNIDECLSSIYKPTFVRAVSFAPTADERAEYGLWYEGFSTGEWNGRQDCAPRYVISFDMDLRDTNGRYVRTVRHFVYVSDRTDSGTYYAFTEIYSVNSDGSCGDERFDTNTIVEIEGDSFEFLEWDRCRWMTFEYATLNIAFCRRIRLATPSYSATFTLDNSDSDCTESISSEYLCVDGVDSKGNSKSVLPMRQAYDVYGNLWQITENDIRCYSPSDQELSITTVDYGYNIIGKEVKLLNGYISCDNMKIYVDANEIRVVSSSGESRYLRYELGNFRRFYMTLLYHSFYESCEMSSSEKKAVCVSKNLLLQLEVTDTAGDVNTYKFYRVDGERALVTVNGSADFYVKLEMVEKVGADAQRVFSNEPIEAYGWE